MLRGIVANNADVNFVKTHNIRADAFGVTLIPDKYTRSAVYILRNPLDMLLSYARHYGMSHADTAEAIARSDNSNAAEDAYRDAVPGQLVGACGKLDETQVRPIPRWCCGTRTCWNAPSRISRCC